MNYEKAIINFSKSLKQNDVFWRNREQFYQRNWKTILEMCLSQRFQKKGMKLKQSIRERLMINYFKVKGFTIKK